MSKQTTIMSREQQRKILRKMSDNDTLHENWHDDVLDTLNTDETAEIDPSTDFFYVLDMHLSEEERSELCTKYERTMRQMDDQECEFDTSMDWLESVTGVSWPDIPGLDVVVADHIDCYAYQTMSDYCAERNVTPEEITIA